MRMKLFLLALSLSFSVPLAAGELSAPVQAAPKRAEGPTVTSALVESALDLIRDGSVEMGIQQLRQMGEEGNAEAFFHLGEINRLGIGGNPSIPIATMYYRLSASLGYKPAALSLANLLFFDTLNDEEAMDEAMELWQRYALRGDPEALYMLGLVYWNGEGGRLPDPIRGYGLMWKAAAQGYAAAVESELEMQEQLSDEARARARDYASDMEREGFTDKPIALYLVMGEPMKAGEEADAQGAEDAPVAAAALTTVATEPEAKPAVEPAEAAAPKPTSSMPDYGFDDAPEPKADTPTDAAPVDEDAPIDWLRVWHIEVGYAMSEEEVIRLLKVIQSTHRDEIGSLHGEVTESLNRPGLYRLVFGPLDGIGSAVTKCVGLKRAGFDCFAKPPVIED